MLVAELLVRAPGEALGGSVGGAASIIFMKNACCMELDMHEIVAKKTG